jgi:hypothetical protein
MQYQQIQSCEHKRVKPMVKDLETLICADCGVIIPPNSINNRLDEMNKKRLPCDHRNIDTMVNISTAMYNGINTYKCKFCNKLFIL